MSKINHSKYPAYFALLMGLIIIGFAAIFVRLADAPGIVIAFYRMMIGSILMILPLLHNINKSPDSTSKKGVLWAMFAGILFAVDLAFWTTGVTISGATNPTLMANTSPIWVGIGAFIFFKEQLRLKFWIGLFIAMVGVVIVLNVDIARDFKFGLGAIYGLLAAIFYGGFMLAAQISRKHIDTIPFFWISTSSSAIFLLLMNIIAGNSFTNYDNSTWYYFVALGVIVQVGGWQFINYAQGYLPASLVAPTLLGQPVVTAIAAMLLLNESFSIWNIFGGIAVLVGITILHRSRNEKFE